MILAEAGCGKQPMLTEGPQATSKTETSSEASTTAPLPFAGAGAPSDGKSALEKGLSIPSAVIIPRGTPISVRLQTGLSSASSVSGQPFEAVLDDPLVVDGQVVVPKGSAVAGRVITAKASGRLEKPGYLRVALASIDVNGKTIPLHTSTISVQGSSHEKRNLGWIGGSSAAGALFGGLAGGGKGALIGAGAGAAAGTGVAYATGKHDVGLGPEHRLTFRVTQPVSTN